MGKWIAGWKWSLPLMILEHAVQPQIKQTTHRSNTARFEQEYSWFFWYEGSGGNNVSGTTTPQCYTNIFSLQSSPRRGNRLPSCRWRAASTKPNCFHHVQKPSLRPSSFPAAWQLHPSVSSWSFLFMWPDHLSLACLSSSPRSPIPVSSSDVVILNSIHPHHSQKKIFTSFLSPPAPFLVSQRSYWPSLLLSITYQSLN